MKKEDACYCCISLFIRTMKKYATLLDGIRIAYQEWGTASANNSKRILALHGWLDNSNTFTYLGPHLAEQGYHVVAMDHIGHGRSDHLGKGASYSILHTTSVAREFTHALGWTDSKHHIVGHSMGGTTALIYSAAYHDSVDKLVAIEGFGPLTEADDNQTTHNLRKAIDAQISMKSRKSVVKTYPNLSAAVQARMKAVETYPGQQTISYEAARAIVSRGTKPAESEIYQIDGDDVSGDEVGPVKFTHDPRLVLPSLIYHTPSQVLSYVNALRSPTLLIMAENGWPFDKEEFNERLKIANDKKLLETMLLPGSHHLHADPGYWNSLASHVVSFLQK